MKTRRTIKESDEITIDLYQVNTFYDGSKRASCIRRFKESGIHSLRDVASIVSSCSESGRVWYIMLCNQTANWAEFYNYCQHSKSLSIRRNYNY